MDKEIKLILKYDDYFKNNIVYKKGKFAHVIGEVTDVFITCNSILVGVDWLFSKEELNKLIYSNLNVNTYERDEIYWLLNNEKFIHNLNYEYKLYSSEDGLSVSSELNLKNITNSATNSRYYSNYNTIAFVNADKFNKYKNYISAGEKIGKLFKDNDLYSKIITYKDGKPKINTLVDILFTLDEQTQSNFINILNHSNGYEKTLYLAADKILHEAFKQNDFDGVDLLTQEEQIEKFIEFSKLSSVKKNEIVSDEFIDDIKNSNAYRESVNKLIAQNFGLSKTQQFNVLQTVGAIRKGQSMIYNLSDMGAGKTLMTVQSIYVLDINNIRNFKKNDLYEEINQNKNITIWLPSKNLIAPKLSVKSSWVETFKLFYDVEYINDSEYILSFTYKNVLYKSNLNISPFTTKVSSTRVDNPLPDNDETRSYLIIDEIHQLVQRKVNRKKFFPNNIYPMDNYYSFILSGTLSNLTTEEWFNYIQFLNINFKNDYLDDLSAKNQKDKIIELEDELKNQISLSSINLNNQQKRVFDDNCLTLPQTKVNVEKTNSKKELFDIQYAAKVIKLNNSEESLENLLANKKFKIDFDRSIINTPNFELFYNLVGSSAITAESTIVAEELFGKQKKQHKAKIINTSSPLTYEDINLLKLLHEIANDFKIYKSKTIANGINNAILNLNDGLSNKNIYELLNQYANLNLRFLDYLSNLDIDILKKLPQSNLINKPKLEETDKFKVLQNILSNEPNETYLIVVNDIDAMIKLSEALNIEHINKKDISDPLMYQDILDNMFAKQNIVIVPQLMIKSSLDLIQANRLIQYQLNTEISDIVQTQNRINRIGQTRETKAFYIATDNLQKNIIELFLETYKNISVAHKGIVELFTDMSSQVNVVNDYIGKAIKQI